MQKAVEGEMKNYALLYPKLQEYIWTEKLCNRHCLILPFFEGISDEERKTANVRDDICGSYAAFAKASLYYQKRDVQWRHIGRFEGRLYLFDLGDLVGGEDDERAEEGEVIDLLHLLETSCP